MGAENTGRMALKAASKPKKQSAVSPNIFAGQMERPSERAVAMALGQSYALWIQLVTELKRELQLDGEEWHSSGVRYGWALRLKKKDRNIVHLGPRAGSFVAAFVLGDKAVAVARKSDLPSPVLTMIAEAKRSGEGTPVRIEVRKAADLKPVKTLAKIKVEN
jgi:hypothetical protein